jgi:hypothetical protein
MAAVTLVEMRTGNARQHRKDADTESASAVETARIAAGRLTVKPATQDEGGKGL